MVCCSANPVLHDGNGAAASVHSYRTSLKYRRLAAPGMKKRSPVRVIGPSHVQLSSAALPAALLSFVMRASKSAPMRAQPVTTSRLNLHVLNFRALNLAILYAVQSGVRYPVIACQLSLVCLACAAGLLEPTLPVRLLGVQGNAAPSSRADSVAAS